MRFEKRDDVFVTRYLAEAITTLRRKNADLALASSRPAIRKIAASFLAAGLDPERVTFYRQSDIPEVAELTWLLTCVTASCPFWAASRALTDTWAARVADCEFCATVLVSSSMDAAVCCKLAACASVRDDRS